MRAVRLHAYAVQPRIDNIASPPLPEAGQLTIGVSAVGIGAWDRGVATGRLAKFVGAALPVIMGAELVGRVTEVGAGVDGFDVGDRVMCNPGIVGAWAERVTVPAARCGLAPESLDDAHAAALPVGTVTAKQALDLLALAPGSSLLVLGAGGSVGRAALQLATLRELTVHAIAPSHELGQSRELGAHGAYDAAHDWLGELRAAVGEGLEAVLDLTGGETLRRSTALIRRGGRIVTTLSEAAATVLAPEITIEHVRMRSTTADLNTIAAIVDEHRLTMPVSRTLRFDEVPTVLDHTGVQRHAGKVVARI